MHRSWWRGTSWREVGADIMIGEAAELSLVRTIYSSKTFCLPRVYDRKNGCVRLDKYLYHISHMPRPSQQRVLA